MSRLGLAVDRARMPKAPVPPVFRMYDRCAARKVWSSGRPTPGSGRGRGTTSGGFELSRNNPSALKLAVNVTLSMSVVPRSNPADDRMNEYGRYTTPTFTGERIRERVAERLVLVIVRIELEFESDAFDRRVILRAAEQRGIGPAEIIER